MPLVDVPGLGVVEFPEGVSESEMTDAITSHLAESGLEQANKIPGQVLGMLTNPAAGIGSQMGRAQIERPKLQEAQRHAAFEAGIASQNAAASEFLETEAGMVAQPWKWPGYLMNDLQQGLGALGYSDLPTIPAESIDYLRKKASELESPVIPPQTPSPGEQAIYDWENQQMAGFTTPTMATALAVPALAAEAKLPELAKTIGHGLGKGFATQMITSVPESIQQLEEAIETGEPGKIVPASLNVVATGGLPLLIGKGLEEKVPKVPETLGKVLRLKRGAAPEAPEQFQFPSREVSRARAEEMTREATGEPTGDFYARGLREDEGQVSQGGSVDQGGQGEGGADLEQQAQGQAGGRPVAQGLVRLYQGSGGVEGGGAGGSWWSQDIERAKTYGPIINFVDVPADVAAEGTKVALENGSGTAADALLPDEWVRKSKQLPGRHEAKVHEIEEPAPEKVVVRAMDAIDDFYRNNPKGREQLENHLQYGDDIKKIIDDEGYLMVSNALSHYPKNPVDYFKWRESNYGYPLQFQAAVLRLSRALDRFQPKPEVRAEVEKWIDSQIGPASTKSELFAKAKAKAIPAPQPERTAEAGTGTTPLTAEAPPVDYDLAKAEAEAAAQGSSQETAKAAARAFLGKTEAPKAKTVAQQIAEDPNLTPEQKARALAQGPFTRESDRAEVESLVSQLKSLGKRAKLSGLERRQLGNVIHATQATLNPEPGRKFLAGMEAKYPKLRKARVAGQAQGVFDRETETGGPDILSWINEKNRLMSRSAGKDKLGERFAENSSLWEDAPDKLDPIHQASIFGGSSTPDQVLKSLQDDPDTAKWRDLTLSQMWDEIDAASRKRIGARKAGAREEKLLKQLAEEASETGKLEAAWDKATVEKQPGDIEVTTEDLAVGDTLEVEGEKVRITARDEDGTLTLEDGRKFGVQELKDGERRYVEKFEPVSEETAEQTWDVGAKEAEPAVETPRSVGKVSLQVKEHLEKMKQGDCFRNARTWALENGGTVVHGKLTVNGERFDHAWVEQGSDVVDPTAGVRVDKAEFYRSTKAEADATYTPAKLVGLADQAKHNGPYSKAEADGFYLTHNDATPAFAKGSRPPVSEPGAMPLSQDLGGATPAGFEELRNPPQRISSVWDVGEQKIPSAGTSINASKLPATFNLVDWQRGTKNADIGGGKFDNATKFLAEQGVKNVLIDPFNRTMSHNAAAIREVAGGQADTTTVNNVLNVIAEPEQRARVIAQAADAVKQDGVSYFLIHQGDETGVGRVTKTGSWQENRLAKTYIDEIRKSYRRVTRSGNLITAQEPIKGMPVKQDIGGATAEGFEELRRARRPHELLSRSRQEPGEPSPAAPAAEPGLPALQDPNGLVTNMFAGIDRDRVAMGKLPMAEALGRPWSEDERIATDNMNRDPDYIKKLIASYRRKPNPLTSYENTALLFYRAKLKGEWHGALRDISTAFEDGRKEDKLDHEERADVLEQEIAELDEIVGRGGAGSEAGRRLNAQKQALDDDLTLVEFRLERRAARNKANEPFTKTDEAEAAKAFNEYEALYKKQLELNATERERIGKLEAEAILKDIALEHEKSERAKEYLSPPVREAAIRIAKQIRARAAAARISLRAKLGRTSAAFGGVDVSILKEVTEIGAEYLLDGFTKLAEWGAKMEEEVGPWIRPHLQKFFDLSHEIYQTIQVDAPAGVKRAVRRIAADADPEEVIAGTKEKIAAKAEKGTTEGLNPLLTRLAKAFWAQGIRTLEEMLPALQDAIKDSFPELTELDVLDAFTNRGKKITMSQDAVDKGVRQIKSEGRVLGHIKQLQAAEAAGDREAMKLPKSGLLRDKPTRKYAQFTKLLNDMQTRLGVSGGDPETQLSNAMEASKRYCVNRLADLRQEIATRERILKKKTPLIPDEELARLRAEVQQVQADHDAIFGPRTASLQAQAAALERTIAKMEKELATGVREVKAPKVDRPADPILEPLKQRRDALNDQIAAARKKPGWQRYAEARQRELDGINKRIAAREAKLASGDLSRETKPQAANRPAHPDLEAAKQKLEAVNRQIAEARKAEAQLRRSSPAEVEARLNTFLDREIDRLEQDVDSGRPPTSKTAKPLPSSPEIQEKMAWAAALREYRKELRDSRKVKLTPDERKQQAAATRIATSLADYLTRIANKDYTTRTPRRQLQLDPASEMNRAQLNRVRNGWRAVNKDIEKAGRPRWQRVMDFFYNVRRLSVLSGINTLARLAGFTGTKLASNVTTEAAGVVLAKIPGLREAFERAPLEGGRFMGAAKDVNVIKHLARSYTKNFMRGLKDAADTWNKGEGDLKSLHDTREKHARAWHMFAQMLHEMEKSPLRRIIFEQAMDKQFEYNLRNDIDSKSPAIAMEMGYAAWRHSNRALLLEENRGADALRRAFDALESKNKRTKKVSAIGKGVATVAKMELPILTVPFNFAKQALEGAFGVELGLMRLTRAWWVGFDKLHPEEFDAIARNFKNGSIGGAVALYAFLDGYFGWNHFGGYWEPREKREEGEAKFGRIRVAGFNVPSMLMHHPFLEAGMLANTMGRMMRPDNPKQEEVHVLVIASMLGLMEHSPLGTEATSFSRMVGSPNKGAEINKHLAGYLTPNVMRDLAKWSDTDWQNWSLDTEARRRRAIGLWQNIELGYPGLRQNVPEVPVTY